MRSRLHVAFVGGVERIDRQLVAMGEELGIDVEVHPGHMKGAGAQRLVALVARANVLFLVTGVNSHGAVSVAKREAARSGVPVHILKFCGASRARALLAEVAQQHAA